MLDDESDTSCLLCFQHLFFFLRLFLIGLLELLSSDKSDSFDDDSDGDGSGSGSPGTCASLFFSGKSVGSVGESVGRVSGVGSGIFVPTGIKSIGDVVPLVVFVPKDLSPKMVN